MTQSALDFTPRDPHVSQIEAPRLSRQCQAIFERLKRGPASNHELAAISLKYTSRISDLRAAGIRVSVTDRDYTTGRTTYQLDKGE